MNFWTFLDRNIEPILFGLFLLLTLGGMPLLFCGLPHVSGSGCGVTIDIGSKTAPDAGAP